MSDTVDLVTDQMEITLSKRISTIRQQSAAQAKVTLSQCLWCHEPFHEPVPGQRYCDAYCRDDHTKSVKLGR